MKIGEVADAAGVTTKAIRYYESIGLLPPPARTASGYRDYDADTVERLRFVRDAQAAGLSLVEIGTILELKDAGAGSCEHTLRLLHEHLTELDVQIERLRQTRAELAALAETAARFDPDDCDDPHRCQIITDALDATGQRGHRRPR